MIKKQRLMYIDLLRLLALYYMVFQHTVMALLQTDKNSGIIGFLYDIVPLCPALFLFISGYSMTISFAKRKNHKLQFAKHVIIRGILLCLGAMILFVFEHGFQLPDFIFASGILNTIGYMMILSVLILLTPYKKLISGLLILILIVSNYVFEIKQIKLIPFNFGYEPVSPTIIFGFCGLLAGLWFELDPLSEKVKKYSIAGIGIAGLLGSIIFAIIYGPFRIFFPDVGRYDITRLFNEKLHIIQLFSSKSGSSYYYATVWNFTMECFWATLLAVMFLFAAGFFLESVFKRYVPSLSFLPGRFALFNYFYHLSIIGILVILIGYNMFGIVMYLVILSAIFITGYLFPYVYLRLKGKRQKNQV